MKGKAPDLSKYEMAFKLVVSFNAASKIIGKSGSEISRIKQECGIDCHIGGRDNVFPGTNGQVAALFGSREGIEASLQPIFAKIAEADEYQGGELTMTVLLSSNAVSAVIGSKGSTIAQLKQDTGCKITADKDKHMGEQAVRVTGEMSAVLGALAALLPLVAQSGDSLNFAKQEYRGAGKGDWSSWGPSAGKGGSWGLPALGGWGASPDPWGAGSWGGDSASWGGKGKYGAAGGGSSSSMNSWKGSPGKGKHHDFGWGSDSYGSKGKHEKGKGKGFDDGSWGHQQKPSGYAKGKGKTKSAHHPAQGTKRTFAEMEGDATQAEADMTPEDRELLLQLSQPAGEDEAKAGEEADVNGGAAPHPEVSLEEVLASLEASESLPEVQEAEARIIFMVPSNRIGRILGKGGAVIKEIQKLTSTKLSIDTPYNQEAAVTAIGKVGDVHRAHNMAIARVMAEY